MSHVDWIDFDYALIRLVPCVHRGAFVNLGVVLHAPTRSYLGARFLDDLDDLGRLGDGVDRVRLRRYLEALTAVTDGDPAGGPLAAMSRSERFHWLTAPRSDILQPSPRHPGRAVDPVAALHEIFATEVLG